MKKLVSVLLVGIAAPLPAAAQTGDIIVMRKAIDLGLLPEASIKPPPSQPGTPTPGQTPTPTPTPAPKPGTWTMGDWTYSDGDTCTETSEQRRTLTCMADGKVVDWNRCTDAAPAQVQTVARLEGCSYSWQPGSYSGWDAQCTETAHRTQIAPPTCLRSDGKTVATGCDAATRPDEPLVKPVYAGCTTDWSVTGWSDWSTTCGTQANRTRTVTCVRAGGSSNPAVRPDEECTKAKPAASEGPAEQVTSCYYTPTYEGSHTECVPDSYGGSRGHWTAQLSGCLRSDGTDVTDRNAAGGYVNCGKERSNIACNVTWTPVHGAFGICHPNSPGSTAGTSTATVTGCTASNGESGPASACSATAAPKTQSCTVSYTPLYGVLSACSGGFTTQQVTGCVASDTTAAPLSACDQTPKKTACSAPARTCGTFTVNRAYNTLKNIYFWAGNRNLGDAEFAIAKSKCENEPGTATGCGVNWFTPVSCVNRGITLGPGQSCLGVSFVNTPRVYSDTGYAYADCTAS